MKSNGGQEWHDPTKIMPDEEKWWGYGFEFDGMSPKDIAKESSMLPVNIIKDSSKGEGKEIRYGSFVQSKIDEFSVDDARMFDDDIVITKTSIIFSIKFIDPEGLDWDEYVRETEKCLVIVLEKGGNFTIQDEMGLDVTSDFTEKDTITLDGKAMSVLVKYSNNGEFIPDRKKEIRYSIINSK